jgi:hypothetical protein
MAKVSQLRRKISSLSTVLRAHEVIERGACSSSSSIGDLQHFRGLFVDACKIVEHMKRLGELPEIVVRA